MEVADRSQGVVEEWISRLRESHGSFDVNQTTVSVPPESYDRARKQYADVVTVAVRVDNDEDEILLVDGADGWSVPTVDLSVSAAIEEEARTEVREATGVTCEIDELASVTIAGIRDETRRDCEPVYRLVALFVATHVSGTPGDDAEWHAEMPGTWSVLGG